MQSRADSASVTEASASPGSERSGAAPAVPRFALGGRTWGSRLIVGTGGFRSLEAMERALAASGAEIVTVALRRVDPAAGGSALDVIDRLGAVRAAEHGRVLHGARCGAHGAARPRGLRDRLDQARGDRRTTAPCCPDAVELLYAAETLVDDGFTVLPYTNDDPILARRLEEAGCAAVMPLGSPIGSGMGIRNPYNLRIIVERADGARDPRRGDRHRLRRRAGDGARVRRGPARELGRAREGPRADGARDAAGGRGRLRGAPRAGGIPRRLHAEASTPDEGLPGPGMTLGLLSPRELAVGPLAHRPDRPGDAVGGPPAGEGRAAGPRRPDRRPSSIAALRIAPTWRRSRRSHERQNSASFASPRVSLTAAR